MGRGGFSRKSGAGSNSNVQADKEPRHRASPIRIVRLYPYLTREQRKLIEDAGFGGLLKIQCPTFPCYRLCAWLLRRFDTGYCELVIKGRGRIPVTIDSVHRVLGIPNRGADVKYHLDEEASTFMSEKIGAANGHSPTLTSVEKSLKEMKSADDHFLRTFMVLVISSFLCPTTSIRISPRCFPSLVDVGSIRELNWCKFVVEQLKKSIKTYGRKNSVPGCLFYLVILYLDSLDTRDIQIPNGTPRISAWDKKLVDTVIEMDMKDNGSFGKCLLKKTATGKINSNGASSASAILGDIPEIANFVSANVTAGYSAQKKEVLCNAVGKLCASITNALSKFMHEVSVLEDSSREAGRSSALAVIEDNNAEQNGDQMDEDMLPEESSELRTEDMENTSTDEYGDESSVDGGSTDDSEDDPDWGKDQTKRSKQKGGKTMPAKRAIKFEQVIGNGSGHGSESPKENQEAANQHTEQHSKIMKRNLDTVDDDASQARSTRKKTGEKSGALVKKTTVQSTSSPPHGGPSSSGLKLCDDVRPLKIEEGVEETHIIDLCTPTSSDS